MGIAFSSCFKRAKAFGPGQIEDYVLEQRDIFGGLMVSDTVFVFLHEHILHPMQAVLNAPVIANQTGGLLGRLHRAAQDVVVGLLIRLGFLMALAFTVAPAPEYHKADNAFVVLVPVLWGGKELAVAVFQAAPVLLPALVLTKGLLSAGLCLEPGQEVDLVGFHLQAVVIARINDGF